MGMLLAIPRLLQSHCEGLSCFIQYTGLLRLPPIPYSNPDFIKTPNKAFDFDHDGDLDLLSNGFWLRNDGAEGFTEETLPITSAYKVEPADFDHDNDLDLLVGAYNGLEVMINDGQMNFTTTYIAGTTAVSTISVADQNGDGLEDILYAEQSFGSYTLAWQLNNGDGTFTKLILNDTDLSYNAYPADIDGDHRLDVVAVGQNKIYWYRNTGSSHVRNVLLTHEDTGLFFDKLIVRDTDKDRDPDILTSSNGYIIHLINNGVGTFQTVALSEPPSSYYDLMDAGDMDGDGDLDIISSNGYSIMSFVNNGSNSFSIQDID